MVSPGLWLAGVVFQLIGGSCGVTIVFGIPGALLMAYARAKQQQSQQQLAEVLTPLLEDGGGGGGPQQPQQQRPAAVGPYRCITSKLWWSGVALQVFSVGLFSITIFTILFPPT